MKTLELKHLAPYLPYGLKVFLVNHNYHEYPMTSENIITIEGTIRKPILRPLSDLDLPEDNEFNTPENLQGCTFGYVTGLISEHYDVFGLIEKGLAIDINTI